MVFPSVTCVPSLRVHPPRLLRTAIVKHVKVASRCSCRRSPCPCVCTLCACPPQDPLLPAVDPSERRAVYNSMARTLAQLHAVNPAHVGLGDYGKASGFIPRRKW
jgi:hypothetical protein